MPIDFFDSSIFYLGPDDWKNLSPFILLFAGIAVLVVAASMRAKDLVLRTLSFSFLSGAAVYFLLLC